MLSCPVCHSDRMKRRRRSFFERLRYSAAYLCRNCNGETRIPRSFSLRGPLSYARCPRCHGSHLKTRTRIDRIEGMERGFLNSIRKFFGAPLLYCYRCRLQFYDFHKVKTHEEPKTPDITP